MNEKTSAREQLIAANRRLVAKTKAEIDKSLGGHRDEVKAYYEEYRTFFLHHRGPVSRAEFFRVLEQAHVVYFGDYHTLRESQKQPLRMLKEMLRRGRRVLLTSEVVHILHQDYLDRFLQGELSETDFLRLIDYENTWGFSWDNYKLQFEFARAHKIPMLALNSDPALAKDSLVFRDAMAAMIVAEAMWRNQGHLVAVIFGDFHVAPTHLPAHVTHFLRRYDLPKRKRVIVFQNAELIYWDLAEKGLEQTTDLVRISDDAFCVLNSTPLVKYQSYLNWEMNQAELEESKGLYEVPTMFSNVMTEQVMDLVQAITSFLGIPNDGLSDFTVHTNRDLDFLDKLSAGGDYHPDEIEEIRQQIENDGSYFITRSHKIYLGNLSIDHAAEEASHYLNTKLAGHIERPPNRVFDFYYRIMKEATAFLGSKIINHKRQCYHRNDFEKTLADLRGLRLKGSTSLARKIARDVLRHLEYEEHWLCGKRRGYPRFRKIYGRSLEVHVGVTHSIGYILGDRIYDAIMAGRVRRNEVRQLFRERFASPDRPREYYFDWIDYLK